MVKKTYEEDFILADLRDELKGFTRYEKVDNARDEPNFITIKIRDKIKGKRACDRSLFSLQIVMEKENEDKEEGAS